MDPNHPATPSVPAGGAPAGGAPAGGPSDGSSPAVPASSSPPAPKLVPFGKYLLLERVAVGGMAEVWLAKRVQGEGVSELLAIKRILPNLSVDAEFIKMFVDEARIAGQLQHPGIVPMQELGRIGQSFYIAMEYVWGRDLLQILRSVKQAGEKISFAAAAYVGAKVCEALHYAHVKTDKNGRPLELVHRDVSPQNVLVSFDGKVKLIDFGIAKAASRTTKTQAGTLKGKVGYMSPEQVRGLPVDARSDLFAVGTLLYEMLTIRPLFARGNNFEAMNRVREADVPPLVSKVPDCPPALAAIVMRALARDPGDRFANAQEMQRELTVFLAQHASSFERYELATWLRRIYEDDFAREKARLDALDSIGRPAMAPVAKKHTNPVTSLEIASASIFDAADDDDETQVGERAPVFQQASVPEAAGSEVFFHRDEIVRVGEPNPEGEAHRPLKALFRPGRANAVEAFRAPIVGREDGGPRASPAPRAPVPHPSHAPPSRASVVPGPSPLGVKEPRPASVVPRPRSTLAPPIASASAVPPPAHEPAAQAQRGAPLRGPGRAVDAPPAPLPVPRRSPQVTQPLGGMALRPPAATPPHVPEREALPDPVTRMTSPQFGLGAPPPEERTTPGQAISTTHALSNPSSAHTDGSSPYGSQPSIEVAPELGPVVLKGPTLIRRPAQAEEEDVTFEDGGIREPLVPPSTVSRARIVAVSDTPPEPSGPVRASVPGPAPVPGARSRQGAGAAAAGLGTVPLVGAGDTPSTSTITLALEQMAREASSSSGHLAAPGLEAVEGRISGFALDPQHLDSQIIRQILPPGAPTEGAPRRGEATAAFIAQRNGRMAHMSTLTPRATTGDYLYFLVVALLTVTLGGTAAVALLHADSHAALEIHTVPTVEATVLVDGAPRGRAPVRLEDLAPGRHAITIVAHGYEEAQREVVIEPRESASIEVALRPTPAAPPSAPPVPEGVLPPGDVPAP